MAQRTGHGALPVGPLSRTVLLRTAALNEVRVNSAERTAGRARVRSGKPSQRDSTASLFRPVQEQTSGLLASALRRYSAGCLRSRGLAVNDVLRLQVVGADGKPLIADHEPDVFWAVRGGGGEFGVVTGLELAACALPTVSAGALFFPMQRAGEVLHAWRRGPVLCPTGRCPADGTLQFPPLPDYQRRCVARPSLRSKSRIRETSQSSTQRSGRSESWDLVWTQSPRSRPRVSSTSIWIRPPTPPGPTGCCSTTYHRRRSTRLPAPVMDLDHRCRRWSCGSRWCSCRAPGGRRSCRSSGGRISDVCGGNHPQTPPRPAADAHGTAS